MVKRADHLAVIKERNELKARVKQMQGPAAPPPTPTPPKPYVLQVPLGRDVWVRIEATRALDERHWDRLEGVLALQREIDHSPDFVPLVPDDIGLRLAPPHSPQ